MIKKTYDTTIKSNFKYEEVALLLMDAIADGKFSLGQQLPTENELAGEYGVTRRTLRKALDIVEDKGIISREKGRGTFVTQPDSSVQEKTHSLLFIGDYQAHLYKDIYCEITAECQHQQFSVVPFKPDIPLDDAERFKRLKELTAQADQIICCGPAFECVDSYNYKPSPVRIIHDQHVKHPGYYVKLDVQQALEVATGHLIDLGHKKIAFIGAAPDHSFDGIREFLPPVPYLTSYSGYRLAMEKADLELGPSLAFYGDMQTAERLSKPFLEKYLNEITAIVCETDFRAVGVFHTLQTLGAKVPDDISIIGIGNTPWSEAVSPAMTTVSFNEKEVARLAVTLCKQTPPDEPVCFSVLPKIIARNSTERVNIEK